MTKEYYSKKLFIEKINAITEFQDLSDLNRTIKLKSIKPPERELLLNRLVFLKPSDAREKELIDNVIDQLRHLKTSHISLLTYLVAFVVAGFSIASFVVTMYQANQKEMLEKEVQINRTEILKLKKKAK